MARAIAYGRLRFLRAYVQFADSKVLYQKKEYAMPVRLCRWGGSTGLRLSVQILETAGLAPGQYVTLRVLDNGDIRVRPVGQCAPAESANSDAKESPDAAKW